MVSLSFAGARTRRSAWSVIGLLLALSFAPNGCTKSGPDIPERKIEPVIRRPVENNRRFPALDPATAVPLEVLEPKPPAYPDGYPYAKVKIGPPLYRGKWLAMNEGQGVTFGPNHVLIHHFAKRPRPYAQGERTKSVLVNIHTGEASVEVGPRRYFEQWYFGLAIVFKADDNRPYLLDAEHEDLVLAVPDGAHDYVLRKNYWIRMSPSAKRVWITAQDTSGTVHLYEWEDRRHPPKMPNNPFPFLPDQWSPMGSSTYSPSELEDVVASGDHAGKCEHAILVPPKAYRCIDRATEVSAGGWLAADGDHEIFNIDSGTGFDLQGFCGTDQRPAGLKALSRLHPHIEISCREGDGYRYWYWRPPNGLARLDPGLAGTADTPAKVYYEDEIGRHVYSRHVEGVVDLYNSKTNVLESIGRYDWHDGRTVTWPAGHGHNGILIGERNADQRLVWTDIVDRRTRTRARVQAIDVAIAHDGSFLALLGSGANQHLAQVSVAHGT